MLDALLSADFDGVEDLREQAAQAVVVGGCGCGCPSINFYEAVGMGMDVRVNAATENEFDGLFLFTLGGRLGGIEWVGTSGEGNPSEFPDPARLKIISAA
ncbi:MAG: hypothetical protein ACXVGA_09630 [Mycobacteriaceae bacterium]